MTTKRSARRWYVLCVSNRGYPESLMVRRVYRALADPTAAELKMIRVIDDTGEDYLFPERMFVPIDLPKEAGRAFRVAS